MHDDPHNFKMNYWIIHRYADNGSLAHSGNILSNLRVAGNKG